uniref:PhoLip_ATPase_C domain-containing protein n=1 Tax=Rhabditophanes sp. KR3021 TaxID=114890 RepID=A0AC35UG90_9BILA
MTTIKPEHDNENIEIGCCGAETPNCKEEYALWEKNHESNEGMDVEWPVSRTIAGNRVIYILMLAANFGFSFCYYNIIFLDNIRNPSSGTQAELLAIYKQNGFMYSNFLCWFFFNLLCVKKLWYPAMVYFTMSPLYTVQQAKDDAMLKYYNMFYFYVMVTILTIVKTGLFDEFFCFTPNGASYQICVDDNVFTDKLDDLCLEDDLCEAILTNYISTKNDQAVDDTEISESCLAIVLNLITFIVIHKNADRCEGAKFFHVIKYGRLLEILCPFAIGPVSGVRFTLPVVGGACSG